MKTDASERKKICPRCQAVFPCIAQDCWCNELPQIMPLSETEDCLCPDCLKTAIENKINAIA